MKGIFDNPMPLDKVHSFLLNPTLINSEGFSKLLFFLGINPLKFCLRTLKSEPLFDIMVQIGFMDSKGDIKRLIKNRGLKISGKMLVDKFVITDDCWFDVENTKISFLILQKGKNDFDLLFKIKEDVETC